MDTQTVAAESSSKCKAEKFCGVCGDHALGYNFNAITCESCKAFFRRNALKDKEFKCPFKNECSVDVATRRFCQKCRLKKCFNIGMKKEWILSDEDKEVKRQKIEENRNKKKKKPTSSLPQQQIILNVSSDTKLQLLNTAAAATSSGAVNVLHVVPEIVPDGNGHATPNSSAAFAGILVSNATASNPSQILPCTSQLQQENVPNMSAPATAAPNPNTSSRPTAKTETTPIVASVSFHTLAPAVAEADLDKLPVKCETVTLTKVEQQKIDELLLANEAMVESPESWSTINKPTLIDVVNMTDNAVRRMIKMAKRITAFKELCQDDQIALLKGGCTELMILRSVMSYNTEEDCWPVPQNKVGLDVLKKAKGNVYEEHKKYMHSFEPTLRSNETIMLILTAITLFDSNRNNVTSREMVKNQRKVYYDLLKRYLKSQFEVKDALTTYENLMQKLEELSELHNNHVKIFLEVNPKYVQPLIIELFDINR